MSTINACRGYFNGFKEICNFNHNDANTNAKAILKIFSYLTGVIPIGVAVVYGVAALYGRVTKKTHLTSPEQRVNDQATTVLLKRELSSSMFTPSAEEEIANAQLAEAIISEAKKEHPDIVDHVKKICSENFLKDPTAHLVIEMIHQGVGGMFTANEARAFVVSRIPHFLEKVSSIEYLRSVAKHFFKEKTNQSKIMKCFEKSLESKLFLADLESGVSEFKRANDFSSFYHAEAELRIPLTIFTQSLRLKEYRPPSGTGGRIIPKKPPQF